MSPPSLLLHYSRFNFSRDIDLSGQQARQQQVARAAKIKISNRGQACVLCDSLRKGDVDATIKNRTNRRPDPILGS
jgi:hypothetical protein